MICCSINDLEGRLRFEDIPQLTVFYLRVHLAILHYSLSLPITYPLWRLERQSGSASDLNNISIMHLIGIQTN